MQNPLLTFTDIRFRYGPQYPLILDSFSTSIPHGSITVVLGPNGVGKTTLLYLLLGLLSPEAGDISISGRTLRSYSRQEMSHWVGLVPQFEYIPYPFSVVEYISMGRAPHLGLLGSPDDADFAIVERILQTLALEHLSARNVQELSGGEAQLIRIARALAQEPAILLLDEPTAHLDLANKDQMLHILEGLADKNMTILFTTHDPDTAFSIASHAILLKGGRALASGDVDIVLTSENLSRAYRLPVQVHKVNGRQVVLRSSGEWG
jgi:iron complex transport system ATP-binding protein